MNRNLNRIIAFIICLCMPLGMVAFAEDQVLSVDYNLDAISNELIVSGSILSAKGGVPLVMEITKDGEIFAADSMITGDSDGESVEFTFDGVPFPNNTPSGDYAIYVSAEFVEAQNTVVFPYLGVDRRYEVLKNVNNEIDKENATKLIGVIGDSADTLSIDAKELTDLSDDAKTALAALIIKAGVYEITADCSTDENIDIIMASFSKLSENYAKSLNIAKAVDINSKAELTEYINENGGSAFYENSDKTDYNEDKIKPYFENAMESTAFYKHIKACAMSADTFETLRDGMFKASLVALIEDGRYTDIEEIMGEFPEFFDVDNTNLSKLSDKEKTEAYQAMTEKEFASIENVAEEFDKIVLGVLNSSDDDSDSSSKRPSGGSGGKSFGVDKSLVDNQATSSSQMFTDLDSCEWAREAIESLGKRNIISGRGNGMYDPTANVTRAEFVKIVVSAFGLKTKAFGGEFADVSQSDWYAPYVACAADAGIVTGSNGYFNPLGNITREDMAVILFRAAKLAASENTRDVFYDSDQMSDYAKEAIFAMYENGIINGRGNGMFVPKGTATRAEAAQMVFKIIK